MAQNPIDWPTIEKAVYEWARDATGLTTVWSDQKAMRPGASYVTLKRITAAVPEYSAMLPNEEKVKQRQVCRWTVLNNSGSAYAVTINNTVLTYTKQLGDTITNIRDGLLTLINASVEPVSAVANGSDKIDVTGDTAGVFFVYNAGSNLSVSLVVDVLRLVHNGPRAFSISMQCITDTVVGSDASSYLDRALAVLSLRSVLDKFQLAGIAPIDFVGPQDISQLHDTVMESRAVVTIRFRTNGAVSEDTTTIESVEVSRLGD